MTSKLSAAIQAELIVGGMTQSYLAHELNVTSTTVNNWIKDRKFPDREHLWELKNMFNWTEGDIREMARDFVLNNGDRREYRIAHTAYVRNNFNNDYESFLDSIIALDREEIKVGDEYIGTSHQWGKIFDEGSDFWRILVRDKEIVGYWQASVLQTEYFHKIMRGEITDSELTSEMLYPPVIPGDYSLYFCVILLSKDHRSPKNLQKLLKSLFDVIEEFAKVEIFFSSIGALAFSREGAQICKKLGMRTTGKVQGASVYEFSEIYEMDGKSVASSLIASSLGRDSLSDLYRDHFET